MTKNNPDYIEILPLERFSHDMNIMQINSKNISKSYNNYPPVLFPPVIIQNDYLYKIIDDSFFVIGNIFKIPEKFLVVIIKSLAQS